MVQKIRHSACIEHALEKTQDVSVVVGINRLSAEVEVFAKYSWLHAWQGQSPRYASAAPIVSEKMRRFCRNSKYQAKT